MSLSLVVSLLLGLLGSPASAQGQPAAQPAKPAPLAAPAPITVPMSPSRIAEIPLDQPAMILGIIVSAGPAYFVLNDGGAAIIVSAGPGWQPLAGVREGDRVSVIGQLDRFGSGMFMAGSITTTEGRAVAVKPYR